MQIKQSQQACGKITAEANKTVWKSKLENKVFQTTDEDGQVYKRPLKYVSCSPCPILHLHRDEEHTCLYTANGPSDPFVSMGHCTSKQLPKPTAFLENQEAKLSKSSCYSLNQQSTLELRK